MDGDDLDETIEESFPASDPPANTPETGIRTDGTDEAEAGSSDAERTAEKPA